MNTRPTRRAVVAALVTLPVSALPAVLDSRLWAVWVGVLAGVVLVIGIDLLFTPRTRAVEARAEVPTCLHIGEEGRLTVTVGAGETGRTVRIEALADLSGLFEPAAPVLFDVPSGGRGRGAINLRARRRGPGEVIALWLRWRGPLGLVERFRRIPVGRQIPVIPNFRAVTAAAIRHFRSREFLGGQKVRSFTGEGSEFDSLREFRTGHDPRAIDWKSSARHMKLLSREFREERDQQIVLAFDTGHVMGEPTEGIPRLDHAINAGLLLAFAALKTGDRVGLFAFDQEVRLYSPPRGGVGSYPSVQRTLAGLDASSKETNFALGLLSLLGRLSRRTLVVVFTDLNDSVTVELMVENLGRLAARHLVLCVTLRDPQLAAWAGARPERLLDVGRAVTASDLLRDREVAIRRLTRLGVHCIDTTAAEVSAGLIDRYLLVKRRELV